jgi:hypothetical protein
MVAASALLTSRPTMNRQVIKNVEILLNIVMFRIYIPSS